MLYRSIYMPAIKKYENLDNGDSIYSASRIISKRQVNNMLPPAQPLPYNTDSSFPSGNQSQLQSLVKGKPDRDDLVSKLILNLNNINGLFTSLYLVGDDFHPHDMFVDDHDEFDRHLQGKGFSGGMIRKARREKTIEEKMDEIDQLKRAEAIIRKQIELTYSSLDRNPTIETALENEQKRIQKQIQTKNRYITKKQREQYERNNPIIQKVIHPPQSSSSSHSPSKAKFDNDLIDERKRVFHELNTVTQSVLDGEEADPAVTGRLIKRANLLTFLIGDNDYSALSQYDNIVDATPEQVEEAIAYGREQQALLQPAFKVNYPDLSFNADDAQFVDQSDLQSIHGEQHTPYKSPPINQIDYIRTGKSTILVILKQIQTLIKQAEQLIKKIINNKIVASESDLNMIAEEVTDMIELKSRFPLPIDEDTLHSPEISEYLTKIILKLLDPLIGNLTTYLKINAQLSYKQMEGISQDVEGLQGAGMPQSLGRNLILSDTVKRIHNFDKKYLL